MKRRKPKPMCEHSNWVPVREILYLIRLDKDRSKFVARHGFEPISDEAKELTKRQPWRHWGECSGFASVQPDDDGVGSWGHSVRIYEDRDDEK